MKISKYLCCIAFMVALNLSCEKERLAPEQDQDELLILEYLEALDYDLNKVEFKNEFVIYESDAGWIKSDLLTTIRMSEEVIEIPRPEEDEITAGERQRGMEESNAINAVTIAKASNVRYFIRPSVLANCGNAWITAIGRAATEWNNLSNCAISLSRVFTAANADIIIGSDLDVALPSGMRNLGSGTVAMGTFPASAEVGPFISINHTKDLILEKKTAMMHEFGHNVGFFHTGSNDGMHVHGTPQTESGSVMNPSLFSASAQLRSGDKRTARIYFPDDLERPISFTATRQSAGVVNITYRNPEATLKPYYWIRIAKYDTFGNILAVQFTPSSLYLGSTGINVALWGGHSPGSTYRFAIRAYNFKKDVWSSRTNQITVTL